MDWIGVGESLKRDAHRLGSCSRRGERRRQSRRDGQADEGAAKRHGDNLEDRATSFCGDRYSLNDDDIKAIARFMLGPPARVLSNRTIWATIARVMNQSPAGAAMRTL
jgi:hypothetical protein